MSGVIAGFSVELDAAAIGYPLQAIVRIEPLPGKLTRVEQVLAETPEVIECHGVTGEDCFVAHLVLVDLKDLDRILAPLHDLARTRTALVKSTVVERRLPPLNPSSPLA